jgi:hypothetical protein
VKERVFIIIIIQALTPSLQDDHSRDHLEPDDHLELESKMLMGFKMVILVITLNSVINY